MLTVHIPGQDPIDFEYLVLDFNGTLATDGKLIPGVGDRISELSKHLGIFVITADTNETVRNECSGMPVTIHIIDANDQAGQKQRFIERLPQGVIVIGNGRNDAHMFSAASLAIAVIGEEGCSTKALLESDIAVKHIHNALDLLLQSHRIIATLRN